MRCYNLLFIYILNERIGHDREKNPWMTFGMKYVKFINYRAIIAWREQSLLPLLIWFDRLPHIDKSRQAEQCSSHLRGVIHLPPRVSEQTARPNAHLNGTQIIIQDIV